MRRNFSICLLLAGVTLAIYWPARHYGVVYFDDPLFVTDNEEINAGLTWHGLWWALPGVLVGTLAAAQAEPDDLTTRSRRRKRSLRSRRKTASRTCFKKTRRCWNFTGSTRRIVTLPKILSPPQSEFSFLIRENWRN
jgi:hypothetical protein